MSAVNLKQLTDIGEREHSISRVLFRKSGDDHLSGPPVTRRLKQPTRKAPRAASSLPYLVLLPVGFIRPPGYPDAGALLPHLSTLTSKIEAVFVSMTLSGNRFPRPLTGTAPCRARTFLMYPAGYPRSSFVLTKKHIYYIIAGMPCQNFP